jgi:hypothetical protein
MIAILMATMPTLAQVDANTTPIFDPLTHHNIPQPTWSPTPPRSGEPMPGDITNLGPDTPSTNPTASEIASVRLPRPDSRLLHGHAQFTKNIRRLKSAQVKTENSK